MSNPFIVGEKYTNNDIVRDFKCGNMGGMRKSNTLNALVIVSDHTKSLYDDKWFGDILHYTGMGKIGDQDLECHHIHWIANGGSDTIENTVALCPNCHRKIHVLNLDSDIEKLVEVSLNRED